MNSQPFFIFVMDSKPAEKRVMKLRIFCQNAILRKKIYSIMAMAIAESSITIQPAMSLPGVMMPTSLMNSMNTFHCSNTAMVVIETTTNVSISRSVTSVPSDCAKGILLYCSNTTQRDTSPKRGITRFAAYETNMEFMLTDESGYNPRGASANFQRNPRMTWLKIMKMVVMVNQNMFISFNDVQIWEKLKSS